jgi:opacity protein-like surface antigen
MFFTGVYGGPAIPVAGQVAEFTSVGGGGLVTGGLALQNGIQLQLEIGYRTNPALDFSDADVSALYYGASARYVLLPTGTVHPYLEGGLDLFSTLVSTTSGSTTSASSAGTGFSVQVGAGLQFHLSEQFALAAGVRYDQVLSNANMTSPTGGLVSVLLGGSYYY